MDQFFEKLAHEFQTPFTNSVLIFSVILLIILLSPIILRRFKIPSIIGLIISGIAIGPHGFNLLQNNSAVKLFSTIGLLYIMFIAGLELNLKEFGKNKYKSLLFGFLTFILPMSIGYPVCHYLLGYDMNSSLLIASMFSTHTLVAYPIVSRLGIVRNEAVAITVGGTILTDTAVLLLLAVISGSATGGLNHEFWVRLGISLAVFLVVVVFIVPRLSAWFFKKLEGEKNSHFIFVLSMVFFCAFMAEIAGLEPIIGAFAAGLALNRLIPHTSSLMNRIEFVGNSLFIPFFLISVGMIIDVRVLLKGPMALIVALSLTTVAIVTKWLAAWLTGLLVKYNGHQRRLIFGLSSAHAAATLAIVLVGFNLGIVDESVLNGTVILILLTCMVASFVTENAAKQVALQSGTVAETVEKESDQKLLVSISNPETMERLLDFAITIKKHKNPYPIFCMSVVDDNAQAQIKLLEAKKLLEKAITFTASADQEAEVITTIDTNVASGIKRVSKEIFATEIIIGFSERKNLADMVFGKTEQNIVEVTGQTVFACNIVYPLNVHTKLIIVCPPHSEKEHGFQIWLDRILRLSDALTVRTVFYCTDDTIADVISFISRHKFNTTAEHRNISDWDDFLIIAREVQPHDLIFAVLPRKGGISYSGGQSGVPQKLARHFKDNSFTIIHPEVRESEQFQNFAAEYDSSLIEKGVTQITEGAKAIGKIFKKENEE